MGPGPRRGSGHDHPSVAHICLVGRFVGGRAVGTVGRLHTRTVGGPVVPGAWVSTFGSVPLVIVARIRARSSQCVSRVLEPTGPGVRTRMALRRWFPRWVAARRHCRTQLDGSEPPRSLPSAAAIIPTDSAMAEPPRMRDQVVRIVGSHQTRTFRLGSARSNNWTRMSRTTRRSKWPRLGVSRTARFSGARG